MSNDIFYATTTTNITDSSTTWYYPDVNYPDQPKLTRWDNQVFYEPSTKLQTLFRALQLL